MKVPREQGVKQQRRLEKILPVFALKAVMYKNPHLFSEGTLEGNNCGQERAKCRARII